MTIRLGRALLAPISLIAVLLTACTATGEPDRDTLPDAQTISTDVSVVEDSSPGRLLVLGTEGEITTMRPDGSDPVTLAEPDPDIERTQPTWSPDGSRVAWTERRSNEETYLLVADSDGGNVIEWPSPLLAVYIAWSPDGEHLALTGSQGQGDLLLAIAGPDGDIQVIDQGAPVYFDWAPDGTELLARVSGRFEYLAIDGSGRETVPATGEFRLGAHVAESVLLGNGRDVGEALALANRQGEIERELLALCRTDGLRRRRDRQPGGRDVAGLAGESGALPDSKRPICRSSTRSVCSWSRPRTETSKKSAGPATLPGSGARTARISSTARSGPSMASSVCNGTFGMVRRPSPTAPFSPTGLFGRDYLAYFDQFALSISLWAPDGSAFAYAGGSSLEDAGIWVQQVEGGDPVRVSAGRGRHLVTSRLIRP